MATTVLQYLDPQAQDDILDIGCGDGALLTKIAPLCRSFNGLDASPSFVQSAKANVVPSHSNVNIFEYDCRRLNEPQALDSQVLSSNKYNKVFSNAAMHWILRDETTRTLFFSDVFRLLKPGGSFVFEQGGAGNVSEVHAALRAVLHHAYGVSLAKLHEADPWYFPSEQWMRNTLESAGFTVEKLDFEYRPSELTPETADGSGGLVGWVKLMAASFLDAIQEPSRRDEVVQKVCEALEPVITREDGRKYLGYVRLRVVARKPR